MGYIYAWEGVGTVLIIFIVVGGVKTLKSQPGGPIRRSVPTDKEEEDFGFYMLFIFHNFLINKLIIIVKVIKIFLCND